MKVIIAGNGPSLKHIDYSSMPQDADIFRCNQFYFEDNYFLGKNIKKVFFRPSIFLEQYYTIKHIIDNKEYFCDEIIFAGNDSLDKEMHGRILCYAVDVIDGYEHYIKNLYKFDAYKNFNTLYYNQYISMGVYMCAVAVACGYRELYLVGIDFYDKSLQPYAFSCKKPEISKLINVGGSTLTYQERQGFHSIFTDLEALNFLRENYNIKIYSLVESSPATEYFPISELKSKGDFVLEKKNESSIKDIMIPDRTAYLKVNNNNKRQGLSYKIKRLLSRFIFFLRNG